MNEEPDDNQEAVGLLYEWLPRLYETAERRYVAADNRVQWLLGLSITLFVSVGALLKVSSASFVFNNVFWFTLGVLGFQSVFGLFALAVGSIKSPGLESIIQNGLGFSANEFKNHALGWANSDILETTKAINRKGWFLWILLVGFMAESLALFWWITTLTQTTNAP